MQWHITVLYIYTTHVVTDAKLVDFFQTGDIERLEAPWVLVIEGLMMLLERRKS